MATTQSPEMLARYFDDLEVGDSFTTKGRTITEADLVNFAALTWDTYPLHVDAEWASKTMFGERIAHGMLVLSYAAGLVPMQPGPIVAFTRGRAAAVQCRAGRGTGRPSRSDGPAQCGWSICRVGAPGLRARPR